MPARKRQQPPSTPEVLGGRRRSTRIGSSGKKSQYFEANTDESESDVETTRQAKRAKTSGGRGRRAAGRGKTKRDADSEEDDNDDDAYDDDEEEEDQEEDDEEDYDDEQDEDNAATKKGAARGKSRPRPAAGKAKPAKNNKVVSDDDDEDDDFDENAPMEVTFIPNVQLRPLDGIDYEDDRLHKNTLLFLKDLKANNKRPWLKSNDKEFRRSLEDWKTYVETFTQKLITADETVPELPTKDIIFRIYRDIRFSKDPTPYKAHYSAAWSRTGKKGPYACYYVHCEPGGKSFVGGGLWHPEKQFVDALRESIDARPRKWRRALGDESFRSTFLPKVKPGDEEAAVKAFTQANQSNALKKKPQDYSADHRDIELLKLRNYTIMKKLPDSIFTEKDGQGKMSEIIESMVGFITFLNKIIMPDPNESDSDSDEEEE